MKKQNLSGYQNGKTLGAIIIVFSIVLLVGGGYTLYEATQHFYYSTPFAGIMYLSIGGVLLPIGITLNIICNILYQLALQNNSLIDVIENTDTTDALIVQDIEDNFYYDLSKAYSFYFIDELNKITFKIQNHTDTVALSREEYIEIKSTIQGE